MEIKFESIFDQTLRALDIEPNHDLMFLNIPDKFDRFSVLLDNKYVVIHVGSGNLRKYKQWDIDKWDTISLFLNKYCKVIQIGHEFEHRIESAIDLRGKTNILETAWILKNAHFVLGVDSGIIHLARTQGTKSIALYGPTPKEVWGYDKNYNIQTNICKPCWRVNGEWWTSCKKDNVCMTSITIEQVKKIAKQLIENDKAYYTYEESYDYVVCLATKNRSKSCYNLLKQISLSQKKIMVICIDDGSNLNYSQCKEIIRDNRWIYIKHSQSYGKERYWETINTEWKIASNFMFKYLIQLCDDYELCNDFFDKIQLFMNEFDEQIALNIWLDNRVINNEMPWGIDTKAIQKNNKFYETGWVDGAAVFYYDTMKKLHWQVNPISFPDKKYIHKMCSGVWEQISNRLKKINCRVFCPEFSLVNHLESSTSQMNQYSRKKENLISIGFDKANKTNKRNVKLNLGLIARCNHTGLGIVAREFRNNINFHSYFAVDECSKKNAKFRNDWVQNRNWCSKLPISDSKIQQWFKDSKINVLFTVEKPYNKNLYKIAHEYKIKTVLMLNWEWFMIGNKIYDDIDLFVAPTKCCYEMLKQEGYKSVVYIPHPVNTDYLKYKQRKEYPKVFLHNSGLGTVGYRKSTQEVIDAFSMIKNKDLKLIIRNQTGMDLKIKDKRIEYIVKDIKEYKDCYSTGDIAIQPSKWEGVGLTILEAMACGIPVVTTDAPPMNEFPADSSLLVNISKTELANTGNSKIQSVFINVNKLSQTIQMLSEMDISYLSFMTHQKIMATYSWNIIKKYWDDLFKNIL